MTNSKPVKRWMLTLAAASGLWALPVAVLAQYRTGSDGHALDANNQAGSGGFNSVSQSPSNQAVNNAVVVGNVPGLQGFSGPLQYRDPTAFTGALQAQPSSLLQQRSGATNTAGAPSYALPQVLYNSRTTVAPPPGFVQQGTSQSYAPSPVSFRQSNDTRLDATMTPGSAIALPTIGEPTTAGPVDASALTNPQTVAINTPYGTRAVELAPMGGRFEAIGGSVPAYMTDGSRLSEGDINRLRRDLSNGTAGSNGANAQNREGQGSQGLNSNGAGPQGGDFNTGQVPITVDRSKTDPKQGSNDATPNNKTNLEGTGSDKTAGANPAAVQNGMPRGNNLSHTAAVGGTAVVQSGDMATGQSQRFRVSLPSPSQQSSQYAELSQRFQAYQSINPKSDSEATRLFQQEIKLRRQLVGGVNGKVDATGSKPPEEAGNRGGINLVQPRTGTDSSNVVKPVAPLKVGGIADSIAAPGLRQLVRDGEDYTHKQQFKEAISKFTDARTVAPNNTLIAIDLANAELGAGFYTEAEQNLREAFATDPTLLMGQFDIRRLIGDDRIQILIADLKRIASSSGNSTPVFLLAYMAYNMDEGRKALDYLDLAETRSGGQDELIRSLKDHWQLPVSARSATQPASGN